MNKKLLALAIGAAVAMPATALASGPTLYGQIDLSVENVDVNESWNGPGSLDGEPSSADPTWVLRNNSSRIGVRGEVETNVKNLKGLYQAEFGLKADDGDHAGPGWGTGTNPLNSRNTFVGLEGGFGTVKMGYFDSPLKQSQGKVDQFNDSTFDLGHYVAGDNRLADIVQYSSPKIADALTVNVAINTDDNDTVGSGLSTSVVFEQDELYAALAYDRGIETQGGSDLTDVDVGDEAEVLRLSAGYNADGLELGLMLQQADRSNERWDVDTSVVLSGAIKAGAWKFKAQYGQTEAKDSDEIFRSMAVGADYALGKSTTLYALAGRDELKDDDDDRSVFGVGLRQKF